jgi:alpha-1,3-rhamnosyl/mannosyltransferase
LVLEKVTPISVGFETDILRGSMTGIGNYCFHLVKALLEQKTALEFYEFSHLACRPFGSEDLARIEQMQGKHADSQKLSLRASLTRKASLALRAKLAQAPTARRLYREFQAIRFQRIPQNVSLDVFHAFRYVPFADLNVPVLPVVYDLSFVRYPDAHPKDRLRQLEKLPKVVERAAVVHTISDFSKAEIVDVYGCPPDKIVVAPPAASSIFRPLGQAATEQALVRFDVSYKAYFLAVGTLEPRKNLRTLIMAYAQLSPAERRRMPLAIVGNSGWGQLELPPETANLVSEGSLRFLGSVSDTELRALYEGAVALLFPSIYEGFGMPVVEALACGTEVVHGENTCMDEITRGHAITVAATDVHAWVAPMRRLMDEPTKDDQRVQERIALASAFSWSGSAEIVAGAYKLTAKSIT